MDEPLLVLLGGPNGAGKSTLARSLLPTLGIEHFVNADDIARGMSENVESVAISAGRAMIQQMRALQTARESFAFESTLASRSFAKFATDARGQGYRFLLYYVWVPSPDVSVRRVARRVEAGGHNVPEADIRRRYLRSVTNFLSLYSPIADGWIVFENPDSNAHRIVAVGGGRKVHWVSNEQAWNELRTAGQS